MKTHFLETLQTNAAEINACCARPADATPCCAPAAATVSNEPCCAQPADGSACCN